MEFDRQRAAEIEDSFHGQNICTWDDIQNLTEGQLKELGLTIGERNKVLGAVRPPQPALPFDPCVIPSIDANMASMLGHFGACAAIHNSKLPEYYVVFLRHLTLVYLYTLPLAMSEMGAVGMPVSLAVIAALFFGIDQLSSLIEDPFVNQVYLPLDVKCTHIQLDATRSFWWYVSRKFPGYNTPTADLDSKPGHIGALRNMSGNAGAAASQNGLPAGMTVKSAGNRQNVVEGASRGQVGAARPKV
jgi:hypothetical protein